MYKRERERTRCRSRGKKEGGELGGRRRNLRVEKGGEAGSPLPRERGGRRKGKETLSDGERRREIEERGACTERGCGSETDENAWEYKNSLGG